MADSPMIDNAHRQYVALSRCVANRVHVPRDSNAQRSGKMAYGITNTKLERGIHSLNRGVFLLDEFEFCDFAVLDLKLTSILTHFCQNNTTQHTCSSRSHQCSYPPDRHWYRSVIPQLVVVSMKGHPFNSMFTYIYSHSSMKVSHMLSESTHAGFASTGCFHRLSPSSLGSCMIDSIM